MQTTSSISVLIVDDHPVVRQGLRMLVSQEPNLNVCGEADSLDSGLKMFRELRPDIAIVDVSLQKGSGLELVKEITSQMHTVRILMCSMHEESLFAERALHAGAKGYINKDEAPDKLVKAIRCVAMGRIYLSEEMTEKLLSRQVGSHSDPPASVLESLSDRELEVFEQIGHGITTRQIAERLHLSPKTVETYRENIKQKLGLTNATQLTQHAVRWVLES